MKKHIKRVVIITRPKESLGYYEYFIDIRKKRFLLFPSNELKLFTKALHNISEGKNPSKWILTKPSEKDFGIQIKPISENCFYQWDDDLYYFPNNEIKEVWFNWNWINYQLSNVGEIHGIRVKKIIGTTYSYRD